MGCQKRSRHLVHIICLIIASTPDHEECSVPIAGGAAATTTTTTSRYLVGLEPPTNDQLANTKSTMALINFACLY
jgi:hypothetical protein